MKKGHILVKLKLKILYQSMVYLYIVITLLLTYLQLKQTWMSQIKGGLGKLFIEQF